MGEFIARESGTGVWCRMKIEVLGSGCANCKKLEANVRAALKELGKKAEVVKVEDIDKIMDYGVMMTPALVIDGKVVLKGRVASVDELKKLLN